MGIYKYNYFKRVLEKIAGALTDKGLLKFVIVALLSINQEISAFQKEIANKKPIDKI
ncbi:MAG: hypothetical protein EZS28_031936, partial [Streblomastix strix]